MIRTVGLVARFDKKKAIKLAEDIATYLGKKGLKVYVENTLMGRLRTHAEFIPLPKMKADLIIAIGGDGTILRTCLSIPKPEPPMLTINMGIRGFLTEVESKLALGAIDKCLKGEYTVEKCMKLRTIADNAKFPDALNEVVVTADEPGKVLYARILKDKEPILGCQADGLMISTQTGSTGYSLSAGGPVLDPDVDAFVLTPMYALTVFRSIVFPANSSLTIEIDRPRRVLVSIDGQRRQIIESRQPSITVMRSDHETLFVRFSEDFYHRLRSRLLFKGIE